MPRPLIALAAVFAVVIVVAAALLHWPSRNEAQQPAAQPAVATAKAGGDTTVQAAASPEASPSGQAAAAPAAPKQAEAAAGAGPEPSMQDKAASAPAGSGAAPAAAAPAVDIVRVERNGEALIAGRAKSGAEVEILADGEVIARTTADGEGAFVAIPEKRLAPGSHDVGIREAGSPGEPGADSKVAVTVPAAGQAPAQPDQQVAATEPDATPQPKPTESTAPSKAEGASPTRRRAPRSRRRQRPSLLPQYPMAT